MAHRPKTSMAERNRAAKSGQVGKNCPRASRCKGPYKEINSMPGFRN